MDTPTRSSAESARWLADWCDEHLDGLPEPRLEANGEYAAVMWSDADADLGKQIVTRFPGSWSAGTSYLYRVTAGNPAIWVHLAKAEPVPVVVDARELATLGNRRAVPA